MSELTFAPINCRNFIEIKDSDIQTSFPLYSTNTPDSCGSDNLTSKYTVFFSKQTFQTNPCSLGQFEVELLFSNRQRVNATCNIPSLPNEESELYLTNLFPVEITTGEMDKFIRNSSVPGRLNGKVILKSDIVLNDLSYSIRISFDFFIQPEINNLYSVGNIRLLVTPQSNKNSLLDNPTLLKFNKSDNLSVFVEVQTDIIGLNLGEMYCRVENNKRYPNGYPQKYRGVCADFEQPKNEKN